MENPFKSAVDGIRSGMMNEPGVVDKIFDKPISLIHEDPTNPRSVDNKGYAEESLKDLAEDIKTNGVINAIVVREHPSIKGEWQIISGHRRFRAAQLAGLTSVPVRISKNKDFKAEQIAENLHREDLSLLEMSAIISEFVSEGLTSYQISEKIHKSQTFVAQHMNLLKAPKCIREMMDSGLIKNAMQGSELCRAYRDNPERTESICNLWKLDNIEPNVGMIREFRKTLKIDKQQESRLEPPVDEPTTDEDSNEAKSSSKKKNKMLRRYIQIRAEHAGIAGVISLDRVPSAQGLVWFIPDGYEEKEAFEVDCSAIKMLSIAEHR